MRRLFRCVTHAIFFFFSSRRRHTRCLSDWSSDVCSSDLIVGCVETISERHLLPVLEAMLHQFPFRILGLHCDNGSEFINHQVAALLNKLLVEFTKSRAYRTTDNALVEGKNGAVVRKHIGYGP